MKILYEKSFYKDIAKIADKSLNVKLLELIETIKRKNNLSEITSIMKMSGYSNYYRIRIKDFRLGIKCSDNTITLIRFMHRKEIYRFFP